MNTRVDKPRILIICTHFHSDRTDKTEKIFLQTRAGLHVGSMIDLDKYDVKLYHESYHGPYDTQNLDAADLVFLTGLQKDFDRMRQIAYFFRRRGTPVVAGGNICTMFPEFASEFFDAVSVGGVECTLAVMQDFERGQLQKIYRSPQTQLSNYVVKHELLAANGLFSSVHYIEASRGCNFKCDFCVIPAEGATHTTYRIETVAKTIQNAIETSPHWMIQRLFPVVFFIDNNFGNNLPHLRELCTYLKQSKVLRGWGALITQNVLQNRDIIKMMADSGCRVLFTGIESFNDEFLDRHNKIQNTRQTTVFDDIKFAQDQGIAIMYPYMFDPRLSSVTEMKQEMQMLAGLETVAFPDFFTIVAPLVGTKLFWDNIAQGELLPNLRLRDLDGQTIAYRQTVDADTDYSEFLKLLFSDPMQLLDRVQFWRNLLAKTLKIIIRHPLAGYIFCSSSLNQFKGMFKLPEGVERNFIGGQDILDPQYQQYPDDISPDDHARYFEPITITDEAGHLQPWLQPYQPQTQVHRSTQTV